MNNTAIVLASGMGKRMGMDIPKQFIEVNGKPLIYYALKVFNDSEYIQNVVLATSDIELCREIVDKYNLYKVSKIVEGGKERYNSVYNAIASIEPCDYVFIHDGARPNVSEDIIREGYESVVKYKAAIAAVKVKDTVKISDENGFVSETPDRSKVYIVQTPQIFEYKLIFDSYSRLIKEEEELIKKGVHITDDAMVVEYYTDTKVFFSKGAYDNIKVTTPEDLVMVRGK